MTSLHKSRFGARYTGDTGILQLMDDIVAAKSIPGVCMLGGGNPAILPAANAVFAKAFSALVNDQARYDENVAAYAAPAGHVGFRATLAAWLNQRFGWDIDVENVLLTNGSQNAFFQLFNLLAGSDSDGQNRQIVLPLAPEYIGYTDTPFQQGSFRSFRPSIEIDQRRFKYHVDFEALSLDANSAAICTSRPTNPTGNVLCDDEVAHLAQLAEAAGIPLILDNAYGLPFPGIINTDCTTYFDNNTILCLSFSKLGLPGIRTGIVIAQPEIIKALSGMNAIMNLAPSNIAPAALEPLFKTDIIDTLCAETIAPYYRQQIEFATALLDSLCGDLPMRIHRPEGSIFLWLWCEDLPIHSQALYEACKQNGLIVVPGQHFFPGLDDDWPHKNECLRLSIAPERATLDRGIRIFADTLRAAYGA